MEKLWTTAEAAQYLGVTEEDVERLVRSGQLTGHKLGGQFLRFQPDQVKALKPAQLEAASRPSASGPAAAASSPWRERVRDFVYFNDLYLISAGLLVGLVVYLLIAS
ncbi:MAG: helix-turn-helix domain-containing protein [Candidatus Omnitrophica bacterium]|nr:helix-turn-helix domain-containing protein [Candidatus Omnitrophota bacterium]